MWNYASDKFTDDERELIYARLITSNWTAEEAYSLMVFAQATEMTMLEFGHPTYEQVWSVNLFDGYSRNYTRKPYDQAIDNDPGDESHDWEWGS